MGPTASLKRAGRWIIQAGSRNCPCARWSRKGASRDDKLEGIKLDFHELGGWRLTGMRTVGESAEEKLVFGEGLYVV